jgi:hypothetical protein
MTHYKNQLENGREYFEEVEHAPLLEKRKRLTQRHYDHELQPQAQGRNRYDVEIAAWVFVGSVGILMTLGSIAVAIAMEAPQTMIIPMLYMGGVMVFMRRPG